MRPTLNDDDEFGQRLRPYLDEGVAHLPLHVEQRLALARAEALSRARTVQTVPEFVLAGGSGMSDGSGGGRWRMGLAAVLLAGVAAGGSWWAHTQQLRNDEVEQDVTTLMGGTVGDKGELGALDAR